MIISVNSKLIGANSVRPRWDKAPINDYHNNGSK